MTVSVVETVEPLAEQFVKPVPSVIAGLAGMVKPAAKPSVIVSPPRRLPFASEVNVAVQVARAPAARVVAPTDAEVTAPAVVAA